jgi:hypothetical protein
MTDAFRSRRMNAPPRGRPRVCFRPHARRRNNHAPAPKPLPTCYLCTLRQSTQRRRHGHSNPEPMESVDATSAAIGASTPRTSLCRWASIRPPNSCRSDQRPTAGSRRSAPARWRWCPGRAASPRGLARDRHHGGKWLPAGALATYWPSGHPIAGGSCRPRVAFSGHQHHRSPLAWLAIGPGRADGDADG